jgi:hypothetical protein
MPEIFYGVLIGNATPLPAGGAVESAVFDVNGARSVHLMFGIPSNDPDVHWSVHFGPTTNNAYAQTRQGTFGSFNTIAVAVPVFGPGMLVVVENRGQRAETVDGNLYFIRDLP